MKNKVVINKFDGGLNTKISALQGQLNESPDLQNVQFDDVGAVYTRNGYAKVNSAAMSGAADILHSYRSNSGADLLAVYGTVFELSGTALVAVSGSTDVFTAGVRVHGENNQNYAFFGNGSKYYKYNGTDFTVWGVSTPTTAAMSSIVSAACTLAGSAGVADYAYRVAFITSTNVESAASPVKTFTITNTCSPVSVYLNGIAASYGIAYVSVYRNDYLLETVTAGATAYVSDVHATLTEARDTTIVSKTPPAITVFLYHGGYMFGAIENSTNLYYTEINSPEAWDPSNYIRVGDGDGYTIRGLAVYNNGLVIAKEDGYGNGKIYVLYMPDSDPDNWSLVELDLSYGSVSPKVMCRFSTFLMMLNRNGVYDLSQVQMGVMDSGAISYPIEPDVDSWVDDYLKNATAVNYKNRVWLSVPYLGGTTNNRVYQYDFVRGKDQVGVGAWSRFTGMAFKDLCLHAGTLYATDYSGYIYKLNYGTDDDGSAIDSYFKTMHIHGLDEHHDNWKVWRYALVTLETSGNWDVTVSWNTDYNSSTLGSYALNVDNVGSLWGTFVWGVDLWGATYNQKVFRVPINVVSRSIQLKFATNAVGNFFKLYKISLHYALRGVR